MGGRLELTRQLLEDCREVLLLVETVSYGDGIAIWDECPVCHKDAILRRSGTVKEQPHEPDCKLDNALTRLGRS
jgi:hypothetical protein